MKLLLDECVTRFVKRDLVGHNVHTIDEAGFKGLENGDLSQKVRSDCASDWYGLDDSSRLRSQCMVILD